MNPALDRYVEENYDRLMAAAVNILGPEDAGDALHTVLLKLYGMESDRVNAMIESDYVQYYMTRSLINERNDNSTYAPPGIGFRNAAPSGGVESVMRDVACGDEDAPSLSEVLGKVKSAAYDAVSALVKELRLNVRLNDAMKRGANSLDRIVYAKVVMEGHTIRGLEKATGIPRSTLFESYTRVRKALAAEELKFKNE
jgi:hypothetical protein